MKGFDLLALDVDGTLVDETGEISPRLQRALTRCQDLGMRICLCTGRALTATTRYLEALNLHTPPVVFNGAWVPSLDDGKPLVSRPLPRRIARIVAARARDRSHYLELHTEKEYYVEHLGGIGERQAQKLGIEPIVAPFDGLWDREPIVKAQFIVQTEAQRGGLQTLQAELEPEASLSWGISPGFDGHFANVMCAGVSKCASLDILLRELGIPWERVFGAGDSPSDLAYVQRSGCGVIMSGAPLQTQRQAPRVVPPAKEDGLARAIETLVLG
jgi:hypothetical protein